MKRNEKSSERVALSSRKKKKKGKDGDPPLPSNRIVTSSCVRGRAVKLLVAQSVCEEHFNEEVRIARASIFVSHPNGHFSISEIDLCREI